MSTRKKQAYTTSRDTTVLCAPVGAGGCLMGEGLPLSEIDLHHLAELDRPPIEHRGLVPPVAARREQQIVVDGMHRDADRESDHPALLVDHDLQNAAFARL